MFSVKISGLNTLAADLADVLIERWCAGLVGLRFEIALEASGLYVKCGTDRGFDVFAVTRQPAAGGATNGDTRQ